MRVEALADDKLQIAEFPSRETVRPQVYTDGVVAGRREIPLQSVSVLNRRIGEVGLMLTAGLGRISTATDDGFGASVAACLQSQFPAWRTSNVIPALAARRRWPSCEAA